jgi:hypothetical protein
MIKKSCDFLFTRDVINLTFPITTYTRLRPQVSDLGNSLLFPERHKSSLELDGRTLKPVGTHLRPKPVDRTVDSFDPRDPQTNERHSHQLRYRFGVLQVNRELSKICTS